MKKSYFDYFSFSVYRYAPESMKIYWKGKQVELPLEDCQRIGYILLTEGKKASLDEIKRIYRKRSKIADKKTIIKRMCIAMDNGEYAWITDNAVSHVNIYDIKSKLFTYQLTKEVYNEGRFAIKQETGVMQEYGKFIKVTEKEVTRPKLLKKLCYV